MKSSLQEFLDTLQDEGHRSPITAVDRISILSNRSPADYLVRNAFCPAIQCPNLADNLELS
jgi:hypothetical protein